MTTNELRDRAKLSTIESRLKTLKNKYYSLAIARENPLINILIEDFIEFREKNKSTESNRKTILNSIELIDEYYEVPQK